MIKIRFRGRNTKLKHRILDIVDSIDKLKLNFYLHSITYVDSISIYLIKKYKVDAKNAYRISGFFNRRYNKIFINNTIFYNRGEDVENRIFTLIHEISHSVVRDKNHESSFWIMYWFLSKYLHSKFLITTDELLSIRLLIKLTSKFDHKIPNLKLL